MNRLIYLKSEGKYTYVGQYILWLLLIFLYPLSLNGQVDQDYNKIDRRATKAPASLDQDLPRLTVYLTETARDDTEKARAIYTWITTHLRYDKAAIDKGKRINHSIADILRRKQAVCFGYAQLFTAMCNLAGLESSIVSGYSKNTLTAKPDLEEPDHAWNAVQLNGVWYLIDATWGSSITDPKDPFVQIANEDYFLTSPDRFVLNHLPADPRWQLLPCPVPLAVYAEPADSIARYLAAADHCFDFRDSIDRFRALPIADQRLEEATQTYRFNPSASNAKAYGHALIDFAAILADSAEMLQTTAQMDSLIQVQDQILAICNQAHALAVLFPWQQELYLNTLINQSVALFQRAQEEDIDQKKLSYAKALAYLREGQARIQMLPSTSYTQMVEAQLTEYLHILEEELKER